MQHNEQCLWGGQDDGSGRDGFTLFAFELAERHSSVFGIQIHRLSSRPKWPPYTIGKLQENEYNLFILLLLTFWTLSKGSIGLVRPPSAKENDSHEPYDLLENTFRGFSCIYEIGINADPNRERRLSWPPSAPLCKWKSTQYSLVSGNLAHRVIQDRNIFCMHTEQRIYGAPPWMNVSCDLVQKTSISGSNRPNPQM